jgi:tetratricopeptide (TPR) repeat protein
MAENSTEQQRAVDEVRALTSDGNVIEAIAKGNRYLSFCGESKEFHIVLAMAYLEDNNLASSRGSLNEAKNLLEKALHLDPADDEYNIPIARILAPIAIAEPDHVEAERIIDLISFHPKFYENGLLIHRLATALLALDRPQEALNVENRFLSQDSFNVDGKILRTQALINLGNSKDAEASILSLFWHYPDEYRLLNLHAQHIKCCKTNPNKVTNVMRDAIENKDWDGAIAIGKAYYPLLKEDPIFLYVYSRTCNTFNEIKGTKGWNKSAELLQEALHLDPFNSRVLVSLIIAHKRSGRDEEALELGEQAILSSAYDRDAYLRIELADVYIEKAHSDPAPKSYARPKALLAEAYALKPDDNQIPILQAEIALHEKEYSKVFNLLKDFRGEDRNIIVLEYLCIALRALQRPQEAFEVAQEMESNFPNEYKTLAQMVRTLHRLARKEEANERVTNALAIDPNNQIALELKEIICASPLNNNVPEKEDKRGWAQRARYSHALSDKTPPH